MRPSVPVPGNQLEVGCVYVHKNFGENREFRITAEKFENGRRFIQIEYLNKVSNPYQPDYWYSNSSAIASDYWLVSSTPDDPHAETDF